MSRLHELEADVYVRGGKTPFWWITRIITEEDMRMYNPPHPGSVLREYLGTVSVTHAAKHLGVTRAALSRILNGKAGISAEMALRLSDALGTTPELWIGMQVQYDLWQASRKKRKRITRLQAA